MIIGKLVPRRAKTRLDSIEKYYMEDAAETNSAYSFYKILQTRRQKKELEEIHKELAELNSNDLKFN